MTVAHAIIRAKERYDIDLTDADLAQIARDCVNGVGVLVERVANARVFIVMFRGARMIPLLNDRDSIMTFYPPTHYSHIIRYKGPRQKRPRRYRYIKASKQQ